jgi:muramoyltetrapeptide carboxypeptidase
MGAAASALAGVPYLRPQSRTSVSEPRLIKPKVLKPGDTVGVITPSSPVTDPEQLQLVERTLRYFGLKWKFGRSVGRRYEYPQFIEDRVTEFHDFYRDPEVKAIFCVRGGFGSQHLLSKLDYKLIGANPKILIGYSDITALHLAIHKRTGTVTFHGPVVMSRFTPYTAEHFKRALFETKPLGKLTNPPDNDPLRPSHTLRTIRGGTASGRLVGGNLSLIAATMGTPYEIDTRGKIYFIEDVDEQPYSLDRMLTQQKLAGKLDAAAAVIWGECADCRPRDFKPSFASPYTYGEIVQNILGSLRVPVLSGMTIGHTADQLTLPLGCMARLDADKGELTIEESGVTE